jgi:predicted DNA binding protein
MVHNLPIIVELEIPRDGCAITNIMSDPSLKTEILAVREEKTLHKISGEYSQEKMKELLKPYKVKITQTGDKSMWIQSSSCNVCKFFSTTDHAVLLGMTVTGKRLLNVKLLLPSRSRFINISHLLKQRGIDFTVVKETPYKSQELTQRELEVLHAALNARYFDIEERTSLTHLANGLNVSPTALSETMRRGLKKIVESYLYNKG